MVENGAGHLYESELIMSVPHLDQLLGNLYARGKRLERRGALNFGNRA